MPKRMSAHERQAFLAGQHVGVLSIASDSDRPPLTIPIWYGYEPGGNLTFFTGSGARKIALIRAAGVASFCVQQEQPPYKYVTVEGSFAGMDQPPTADQLLAIARRYQPEDQAQGMVAGMLADGGNGLVLVTIRPDRWLTADFSDESG
jgi:uncharacterized protein